MRRDPLQQNRAARLWLKPDHWLCNYAAGIDVCQIKTFYLGRSTVIFEPDDVVGCRVSLAEILFPYSRRGPMESGSRRFANL